MPEQLQNHRASSWYKLSDRTRKRQIKEALSLIKRLGGQVNPNNSDCPSWGKGIIPHIKTHKGILYADLDKVHLGDLIHEFCHIWVAPHWLKPEMSSWLAPYDGGEQMTQAASYAIAYTLGIDPWIVLSVVASSWEFLEQRLEAQTHSGIQLLVENGLIPPDQFPNIFLSFSDFLKQISSQACSKSNNSVSVGHWYNNGHREYSYPKSFVVGESSYSWSMSRRHTKGRHLTTHWELWGHGFGIGDKRYATGELTKGKLFKFFRDIYELGNPKS